MGIKLLLAVILPDLDHIFLRAGVTVAAVTTSPREIRVITVVLVAVGTRTARRVALELRASALMVERDRPVMLAVVEAVQAVSVLRVVRPPAVQEGLRLPTLTRVLA